MSAFTRAAVPVEIDDLLRQAEVSTQLDDWGPDLSFRPALEVLVASMNESDHPPAVVDSFSARMVGLLSTRLHLVDDGQRHPDLLAGQIEQPIILIGLSRTGTTILHDLMALDPSARCPREWETSQPWPAPDLASWTTDPRIAATDARINQRLAAAPELRTMHPWGATLPSDCLNMFALHFTSPGFVAAYCVDRFNDWLAREPMIGQYATHKRVLQQLQWKGPRGRWTLKEPMHQLNLDLLFAAYPDAYFVQTHREPARSIPSVASVIHTSQTANRPDRDPAATGRAARVLLGACLERSTAVRNANPALDARVLDVAYADTVRDPVGQVRRIHEHFGLAFTNEHADRIERHLASDQAAGKGLHRYRAEDFGLDPDELGGSFAEYRSRFGDLLEEPTRT
jgi:hypothetical protein